MENKINIAAILKDKPKGTKLYSYICAGECILNEVSENAIYVDMYNKERFWYFSVYGTIYAFPNGGVLLYPSYEMRDWSKFAWKKGDVLAGNNGTRQVLFHSWVNDSYTKFVGLHCMIAEDIEGFVYDEGTTVFNTNDFKCIEDEYAVQCYINSIEERLGGKLNRETLEIEKAQPEFKDGDILSNPSTAHPQNHIFIFSKFDKDKDFEYHVALVASGEIVVPTFHGVWCRKDSGVRYATEEEKEELFGALAKEGKAWNAEKKQIVDLKPKIELKPFDKVLVRDDNDTPWKVGLFSHIDGKMFQCVGSLYRQCIPYEGNESLLGTTKDVEG